MSVELFKKRVLRKKILIHLFQVILLVGFIGLWELLSNKGILNEFLFSKPSAIFELLKSYIKNGELYEHLKISIYETILGFNSHRIME